MKRKTFLASLAALFVAPTANPYLLGVDKSKYDKVAATESTLPKPCEHRYYLSTGPERCMKCGHIKHG